VRWWWLLLIVVVGCGKSNKIDQIEQAVVAPPAAEIPAPVPAKAVCARKPTTPDQDLQLAVSQGDAVCALDALTRGADHETPDFGGWTPLQLAVSAENIELVKLLLQWKANVNVETNQAVGRTTPLTIALKTKNLALIGVLIDGGASLTTFDKKGWLPIHWAALVSDRETAELLLQRGSPVDSYTREEKAFSGRPASHIAAMIGNLAVLESLASHGADLDDRDALERTILHVAANYGRPECLKFILKNAPYLLNSIDYRKKTPLHEAVFSRSVPTINLLLDMGADPLAPDESGWTARDEAKRNGLDPIFNRRGFK
jgi:ankyrin repeat protein